MSQKRKQGGFTLIELLITVTIIGILSGIIGSNILYALQRARQRRTMADMRSLALAIDSYVADHSVAPGSGGGEVKRLEPLLLPTYLRRLPAFDAWSSPVTYAADGRFYTLRSFGADRTADSAPLGATTSFSADIILSNGMFAQWPEGPQSH